MGKKAQIRRSKREQVETERIEFVRKIEKEKNPWLNFWRRADFWIYSVCLVLMIAFPFLKKDSLVLGDQAVLHTSMGDIEIAFYKDSAPRTVENFSGLAKKQYYNDLLFHRVIKGFMIQTGDPTGTGTGGESLWGQPFKDEINAESLGLTANQIQTSEEKGYEYSTSLKSRKMTVGAVAMANSGPNTNGSQFFIVTEKDQPHLDGQHTVFGYVTKGLDIAKKISEVETDESDKPKTDVKLISVELK